MNQSLPNALLSANSDSQAHNVRMSQKRTKADKAQREADLLDKRSSHRPPQKQGKKPREDFNQAAVRIVEEAAEKRGKARRRIVARGTNDGQRFGSKVTARPQKRRQYAAIPEG